MNRWEYLTMTFSRNYGAVNYLINDEKASKLHNKPLYEALNELGKMGWEVVGVSGETGNNITMKRLLVVKKPAAKQAEG